MPDYFQLSTGNFTQDWSNTGLIGADDDWSLVPSIIGYRGDDLTTTTGTNPGSLTGDGTRVVDVIANQANPNTNTSGGVAEFQITNPTVALQGSGTADAPNLVFFLDATGRQNVVFSFNARDIDGSLDNAVQAIAVQYRIGDTGAWTTLPSGSISDASSGPSLATLSTAVSVTLPAEVNGQSQVQVRVITANAVGNDEWIGIDDIVVTSAAADTVQSGTLSIGAASVVEGDDGVSQLAFTVTRAGGSEGAVGATYTISLDGTADADDLATTTLTGTVSFAAGESSATIFVPLAGDTAIEANETFSVTLSAPTGGAGIGTATALGTIVNDDYPPAANVFINEFSYDPVGTDTGEFIEVAGAAGTDLTGWTLVLYNGNGGGTYSTLALGGTLGDQANGFGFASVSAPGLQNGSPDGIALVDNYGRVIQFISYEGTMTATNGAAAGMTSTDIGVEETNSAVGTSIQLTGTGSSTSDFQWVAGATSSSGAANGGETFLSGADTGQLRIDDASVSEGTGGTSSLTFTVHRAGGFDTSASVDYSVLFNANADADDLVGTVLSGTVSFAAGEFVRTISLPIATDAVGEYNEALTITLANPVGNVVITDGSATGLILNDDRLDLSIMAIQGAGHVSEFVGQPVATTGIVTAVDSNGYYLQDPNGDGDARTSDGLFVFTGAAPAVLVGDAVSVSGTVGEFQSGAGLSVTQLGSATTIVTSSGNALPAAVLIGTGGILPPTDTIDDDSLTSFDIGTDGIDFWESLEGMRVTVDSPIAVSNSNEFGETDIVASLGVGATGVNERGGITISPGDYNPERIQLDDRFGALTGYTPDHSIGDHLGSVTGILNYSFEHYELLATEVVTTTLDVSPTDNNTTLRGDANFLSLATYNLENLDPGDGKYDVLSQDIVYSLGAPDIIAVQEIQDGNGALSGGDLSGAATAQGLIDAIFAMSGIVYSYAEIAPTTANSTGGEPNGNIRNGYLYQADRVQLVEGSLATINDPIFSGTRAPLVATWSFNGSQVTTINVHFTSRGGSDPLFGAVQPPADAGDAARIAQAAAVGAYVNDHLADQPGAHYAILGDWNGFYFEEAQTQLTAGGVFANLAEVLLPEEERYSYIFDGNSQLLDNILVTGGLLTSAMYDAVHINAEFTGTRPTDHDPQVALLMLGITPHDIVLSNAAVDENLPAGTVVGTLSASDSATDVLRFSLVDDADGRFTVDAVTGIVTTTQALDFEAAANHAIVARVTDSAGLSSDQALTISIGDVEEAPAVVPTYVRNDFDGDGRSDVLWRNEDGSLTHWSGEANGSFSVSNLAAQVPNDWRVVGTGDFNGDRVGDILWRHEDGTLTDWLGQASGGFIANSDTVLAAVPNDWRVSGTGDFNGDGRSDILWRHDDGGVANWLGTADGGFIANSSLGVAAVPTDWQIEGTGDFNGDGRADVLWRNDSGALTNWLGTATGGFTANDNLMAVVSIDWNVVGTGDFNGDGISDLLWRHDGGSLTNWLGQSDGGFVASSMDAQVSTDWHVVALGDYNGDGRDDVLWRHDNGVVTNWLAQEGGGFAANDDLMATVPIDWLVQSPDIFLI